MLVSNVPLEIPISTHTLAWRVTMEPAGLPMTQLYFNPHPRMEGDWSTQLTKWEQLISTHTLAWRVTDDIRIVYAVGDAFQPTPSHGG